jgi:hypothetical protein
MIIKVFLGAVVIDLLHQGPDHPLERYPSGRRADPLDHVLRYAEKVSR